MADAERVLYSIVGKDPSHWGAWHRLAAVELKLAKLANAEQSARRALALNPSVGAIHGRLAMALRANGKVDEAIAHYTQAVQLAPRDATIWFNLGNALRAKGEHDRACRSYQKAVQHDPQFVEAYHQLGNLLAEQEAPNAALAAYEQALAVDPQHEGTLIDRGNLLATLGRKQEAMASYRSALERNPHNVAALNNLGNEARERRRLAESLELLDRALEVDPNHPLTLNNRGITLAKLERFAEAEASFRRALELKPDHANALYNLADVYDELADFQRARKHYELAIAADPEHAEAQFRLACHHLRFGDFAAGWPGYEWRWKTREAQGVQRESELPPWDGSDPQGKTILLTTEQGFGDTLQFIRYAQVLQAAGAKVVVRCPERMLAVLKRTPGVDVWAAKEHPEAAPPCDFHAPLLSLPGLLYERHPAIPTGNPYLFADPLLQQQWAAALDAYPGVRVGIAWQGSVTNRRDATRSIALRHFAPLAGVSGVRLIALQKGPGASQLGENSFEVINFAEQLDVGPDGFVDTAAVMTQLDLVITSDTSIAHLAGGLGVPVWVALSAVPEWRWQLEREDSPWYPTMRLFRQTVRGDWEGVFTRMAEALSARVAGGELT
jgi:tetratricopeptide (TPR) repeat protein